MPNLVASTIRQGLYTHVVGRRILYYPELKSTMDEAARFADEGTEEGTVVIAERQSAGRGRQGRSWVSQPGNLLFSVLFRPDMTQLPFISIIGGVAAARAVRKTTGLTASIKWPNDLILDGRKAAGILAESAIVGIGVNVALDVSESEEIASFHPELVEGATSVNAAAGREVDRESLLRQLLLDLDDLYISLRRGASPLPEWRNLLETTGRRVEATFGEDSYVGLAEGVDDIGNLLLRLDDGKVVSLTAGDVTLSSTTGS